jgi:hypothetical protein
MALEVFFQKRAVFCKVISRDTFVKIESASAKPLSQGIKEPLPGVKCTCWKNDSSKIKLKTVINPLSCIMNNVK